MCIVRDREGGGGETGECEEGDSDADESGCGKIGRDIKGEEGMEKE